MSDQARSYTPVFLFDTDGLPAGKVTRWDDDNITIEITDPDGIDQLNQIERPVMTLHARHLPRYSEGERYSETDRVYIPSRPSQSATMGDMTEPAIETTDAIERRNHWLRLAAELGQQDDFIAMLAHERRLPASRARKQ